MKNLEWYINTIIMYALFDNVIVNPLNVFMRIKKLKYKTRTIAKSDLNTLPPPFHKETSSLH